jgi:hypothetical protein
MVDTHLIFARLSVEIVGSSSPAMLDQDIISIRFSERRSKRCLLEVVLNNWDNGSYKYSEGNLLRIGTNIRLRSGDVVLAEGKIISLAPSFTDSIAPTLKFTVGAKPVSRSVQQEGSLLTYGEELLEFHPILSNIAKSSHLKIYATGTTVGMPEIRSGEVIKINGIGAAFSGSYKVKEATHTFDGISGYRTSFDCTSSPLPLTKIASKRPSKVLRQKSKN